MIAVRSILVGALLWEVPALARHVAYRSATAAPDGLAARLTEVERQLAAARAEIARLRSEADVH